jgi:protein TonB
MARIRTTPLATSVLLHVIVYSTLLVMPVPRSVARVGVVVELTPGEPPAAVEPPRRQPLTPVGRVARVPAPRPAQTPAPAAAVPSPAPAADQPFAVPVDAGVRTVADAPPSRSDSVPAAAIGSDRTEASSIEAPAAAVNVAVLGGGARTRTAIPRGGYQVTPSYPATARRLGIEGTTLLSVLVQADGRVAEVVVKQSAGHPDMDRAAADAIRRWRFEPARRGTEAVTMWVELPVEFHLR